MKWNRKSKIQNPKSSSPPFAQQRLELVEPLPTSLEALSWEGMIAEKHVFEGDHGLFEQLAEHGPADELAEVLAIRFSLGQPDHLAAVQFDQLMAEKINYRLAIIAGGVMPARFSQ